MHGRSAESCKVRTRDACECCPAVPEFVSADLSVLNLSVSVRGAETL